MDPRLTARPGVRLGARTITAVRTAYRTGALARVAGGAVGTLVLLTITAPTAAATTGGAAMPWDQPLQRLLDNLAGPTARALVLLAIVACGLLWAFTRNEEGLKKLGQVAFGGAIALGAVTMMASLGFAGAVV